MQIVQGFENVKDFRKPEVNAMSNCDKDVMLARLSGLTVIRPSDLGNKTAHSCPITLNNSYNGEN